MQLRATDGSIVRSFEASREFTVALGAAQDLKSLSTILEKACSAMGCEYYALTQHIDFRRLDTKAIRLHNYPDGWSNWFDSQGLGVHDPVHRASQTTAAGFHWRDVPKLISLTRKDSLVLEKARERGIGDGYTVPANVPGEVSGSVSFAMPEHGALDEIGIQFAQLIGAFAFESARRLNGIRPVPQHNRITERQRDCILWVARGKTDWEISKILGVSRDTVTDHLRSVRSRYETSSRSALAVRAIYEGTLCFNDVFDK